MVGNGMSISVDRPSDETLTRDLGAPLEATVWISFWDYNTNGQRDRQTDIYTDRHIDRDTVRQTVRNW